MTVANTTTKNLYTSNGVITTFAIPFAFIPGEASTVTKVFLVDAAGVETLQVEGVDYNLDPVGLTPANVIMVVAPPVKLLVKRTSPKTQGLNLDGNTPIPAEELEKQLDRVVLLNQEVQTGVDEVEAATATVTLISGALIPDWLPATNYVISQTIIDPTSKKMYRALTVHTSGGDFNTDLVGGEWELVPTTGLKGDPGVQGPNGLQGPQGIQGINGNNGAPGVNGVFAAIASKAEAEAGVDNTKGMTPLRTKEAIDFQLPNHAIIVDLLARVVALEAQNADQETRLIAIETNVIPGTGRFSGSQIIKNAAGPIDILGGNNPTPADGRGDALLRSSAGTEFAKVQMQVRRKTDTEFRFVSYDLIMQFNSDTNVWFIGRDGTDQLDGSLNLDGIVLTVTTNPDGFGEFIGQVSYTSDNMLGANHDTQSEMKWIGQEIPKNV